MTQFVCILARHGMTMSKEKPLKKKKVIWKQSQQHTSFNKFITNIGKRAAVHCSVVQERVGYLAQYDLIRSP